MRRKSIDKAEVVLFISAISRIEEESLRAAATLEVGKCVRNILKGGAAEAEAEEMVKIIVKCPFCDVSKEDLEIIKVIEKFVVRNFS
ncbi:MAG: hypothetical protein PHO56_02840 [Patescibacteria group bacterium]|nr:hypothetical protein [Patescibacteria group bacterium]